MVKLIFGEETYLLDKTIDADTAGIDSPELNVTMFDDEYDVNTVERLSFTEPFLADRRAIVLRLSELKADGDLKNLVGKIPNDVTFIVAADKVDKRSALYKAFKGSVCECKKPDVNKVCNLIYKVAEKESCKVETEAAEEIIKRLAYYETPETNLYAVIGAVRQLCQSGDVTLSQVRAMLPETASGKAWNLLTYICNKELEKAFSLLNYLLDSGESAIGILSLVLRGFRLAWKEKVGVPLEGNMRFQYAPAAKYSVKKLVLVQDILESAVERLKSGAEAGVVSRLALVKVTDALQTE